MEKMENCLAIDTEIQSSEALKHLNYRIGKLEEQQKEFKQDFKEFLALVAYEKEAPLPIWKSVNAIDLLQKYELSPV